MGGKEYIYIWGAGGFGREVKSMLPFCGFEFLGFIDDDPARQPVASSAFLKQEKGIRVAVAIGYSHIRAGMLRQVDANALIFPNLIHTGAFLQDPQTISMGKGNIICAGARFTTDISIGDFCLVNLNATIGHDVFLGDFCSLMPGVNISGNVKLEEQVFIGSGANILQGITVGKGSIVGAGAVVTENVPENVVVAGVPAKIIKNL